MSLKNKLNSFKTLASITDELYSKTNPPNNLGLYDTFRITSLDAVNSFNVSNYVVPDFSCNILATINLTLLTFLNFDNKRVNSSLTSTNKDK